MNTVKVETCPFFRASCGCIGLHVGRNDYVCIKPCDRDYTDNELEIGKPYRGFDPDKDYTPLTDDETDAILMRLGALVHSGYEMEHLAKVIGWINKPQDNP